MLVQKYMISDKGEKGGQPISDFLLQGGEVGSVPLHFWQTSFVNSPYLSEKVQGGVVLMGVGEQRCKKLKKSKNNMICVPKKSRK